MAERRDLRLVMMGTGTFAEPTLRALFDAGCTVVGLVTQPDRAMGSTRGSTRQVGEGMKAIAEKHGVAVYQPESINTPEGVEWLREWRPDLLVVAAYGQILNIDVLATARHGGINVHASLLPKYRGAAPIAWAIYHGEAETGVTIIRMTTGLDAGDMLAQEATPIGHDETAGAVEARLGPLGGRMAVQVIDQIAAGTTQGVKQDKSQVTKAPKLTKEHGLLDWTRSAAAVCNQVRAMLPWPTPYTFLRREGAAPLRLIVHRAVVPTEVVVSGGVSGLVVSSGRDRILVRAGEGVVEILEIQPAGKKRMSAVEFLRGYPVQLGDRLGAEAP
jgi:methionyl-tRNA formyltransferase